MASRGAARFILFLILICVLAMSGRSAVIPGSMPDHDHYAPERDNFAIGEPAYSGPQLYTYKRRLYGNRRP